MQDQSLSAAADQFRAICGTSYVSADPEELLPYGRDQTCNFQFPFDILVKPASPEEIAAILQLCNRYHIPLTPRGGGTGVTGGALPVQGGVVLSVERLNRIIEINTSDAFVIVESGTITADLIRAVEAEGLYFPVKPTSRYGSMVGGNVAENAGSMGSCKYGTTGDYLLNMEVVLPSGDIIWTGANVVKNATGLNLTRLFTGSEGILGIITKVVYRLLPIPVHRSVLRTAFTELEQACAAVLAIKRSGILPSAVELICRSAADLASAGRTTPLEKTGIDPTDAADVADAAAYLLLELQEHDPLILEHTRDRLAALLEQYTDKEILAGQSDAEMKKLWQLREEVGKALANSPYHYRDLDVSIPPSCLYGYIREVEEICRMNGIKTISFGHALDGNLHTMLLLDTPDADTPELQNALHAIYRYAIARGGAISGEHGIGYLQKDFLQLQYAPQHLHLLRKIKDLFDPHGILNPGKAI